MTTREQWLNAAVDTFRPWFIEAGKPLPDDIKVSIGWPYRGRKSIGECWAAEAATDAARHIFLSPKLKTGPLELAGAGGLLGTLLHELCHAALPSKTGHRKPFQKLAADMGMVGPWTATTLDKPTQGKMINVARQLGEFPAGSLEPMTKLAAQKNRHIKCECEECGYIARVARKHLVSMGPPHCPAHGEMAVDQ